jgi:hypothetical protein
MCARLVDLDMERFLLGERSPTKGVIPMAEAFFTPEADVIQLGRDNVQRMVAAKNIPIPMERAIELGLVKEPKAAGPKEHKVDAEPDDLTTKPKKATT